MKRQSKQNDNGRASLGYYLEHSEEDKQLMETSFPMTSMMFRHL
jgi:hypothetical protein